MCSLTSVIFSWTDGFLGHRSSYSSTALIDLISGKFCPFDRFHICPCSACSERTENSSLILSEQFRGGV